MGLAEQLDRLSVCIDTALFIYFIERNPVYLNAVRPVFAKIDKGETEAITSTLTLLEVLVHPFRTNDVMLAEKYREILLNSEGITTFEILNEISEIASKLRAEYAIKAPDALQISTGIFYRADKFLTNDTDLNEIEVLILDDFI